MAKFNANETMKRAEEDFGLGKGQYFKVKEGANKIRLLSPCIPYQSEFKGQTNVKFLCWIIDRVDENKIKLYFMPTTILNAIGGLQMSDDFGFEDVPMPYDITIMAKGAGTKEVEYTVVGARQNTPLTGAELQAFEEKPTIEEVIEKLKEKQSGEPTIQQEQHQTSQDQSGYEKARSVADSLPGANQAVQGNSSPSDDDINVEDIPF
jgi:hypothetical protein